MASSKFCILLVSTAVILVIQEVEGISLPRLEKAQQGNKVKDFLNNVITELGYRVGAIELPPERGGPEVPSTINTNSNSIDRQELIDLTVDTNTASIEDVTNQPNRRLPSIYLWKH